MGSFWRIFKYIWPQWPRIVVIVISALIIAVLLSFSFMTAIPLLKVMMGKEGIHGWVDRKTCRWQYGVDFYVPETSDFTSGFVATRRAVLDEYELTGDYGEYFIDFIFRVLQGRKFRVCELPYVAPPRRSGESKTGTSLAQYMKRGRKYLWTVVRLRLSRRA